MGLKKNLYYEIKDQTVEERQDGVHAYKHKVRTKVYGLNSNKEIRRNLIDILIERVENHKDKIISPIIYNELLGMEIKRNGKVEHSSATHDDQVFSMLMALYVWYEGVNLAERYGLRKTTIRTDEDIDEQLDYYNDDSVEIVGEFNVESELDEQIKKDLDAAIAAGGIQMQEFLEQRQKQEKAQFEALLRTAIGERAYKQKYNIPKDMPISNYIGDSATNYTLSDSVFSGFYNDIIDTSDKDPSSFNIQAVPAEQFHVLEDDDYKYSDHFNF